MPRSLARAFAVLNLIVLIGALMGSEAAGQGTVPNPDTLFWVCTGNR